MVSRGSSVVLQLAEAAERSEERSTSSTSGMTASEYLSRCVASRSVQSRKSELSGVCNCASRSKDQKASSPRLELAHVFACLKATAAKAKVERLASRKPDPRPVGSSMRRVGSQSVGSASRVVH